MFSYSFTNVDLMLSIPKGNKKPVAHIISGFPGGDNLITASRRAPVAATQFGAYGEMVVSMQRIVAGDLTFTLLANSPQNQALQDYVNTFQSLAFNGGTQPKPIQGTIFDNMGNDTVELTNGVILAVPAFTRGLTMSTVTWVLTFEELNVVRESGEDSNLLGVDFSKYA